MVNIPFVSWDGMGKKIKHRGKRGNATDSNWWIPFDSYLTLPECGNWSLNAGVTCFKFHFNKQQRLAGINIDIKYQIMTNQLGMF